MRSISAGAGASAPLWAASLDRIFTDKDEVLAVIERALTLFRDQGRQGERFSDTIARLGFETVQQQLLAD